ncbi:hypothetical protein AALA46_13985 [Enterocloster aldenensis]|jgi:hypothetical protein|uniref:hypothetical protein n=1 Tax=Enterocloster aldenensis TaxID=358742 RepID=UPI0002CCAC4D|nr:hypothetical protein [uncultured Acetatifactor sp.]KAI4439514.1 hypothetical protein C824_002001 [Schaedlerella arabinosiphila]
MAEEKRTETMIAQEDGKEAAEVMGFMEMLDNHEKREFLAFIQGAKFVKSLPAGAIGTA